MAAELQPAASMKRGILAAVIAFSAAIVLRKRSTPTQLPPDSQVSDGDQAMRRYITYIALPVWLASGFADYIWHRRTNIATTTGLSESLMHSLMMLEGGPAVLGALFLENNAGMLAVLIAAAILHESTAIWDVVFSSSRRAIYPSEQHTHSFLEMVPFCVASVAVCTHWNQFLALLGWGSEPADFSIRFRRPAISTKDLSLLFASFFVFGALPHAEELWRCLQAERRGLVGRDTPDCAPKLFA